MSASIEDQQLFRLNAKEYEQMCEIGILPEHGVELIDGLVVEMSSAPAIATSWPSGGSRKRSFWHRTADTRSPAVHRGNHGPRRA